MGAVCMMSETKGRATPQIQHNKPHFPYSLYQECGFSSSSLQCMGVCYAMAGTDAAHTSFFSYALASGTDTAAIRTYWCHTTSLRAVRYSHWLCPYQAGHRAKALCRSALPRRVSVLLSAYERPTRCPGDEFPTDLIGGVRDADVWYGGGYRDADVWYSFGYRDAKFWYYGGYRCHGQQQGRGRTQNKK
eukprot:2043143-Rhodomonas_salina.1